MTLFLMMKLFLWTQCGYSLFRRDRNRHGGGVAILLSNCIPFCPHLDLSGGQIESIWGELYPRSKRSLLLCCAY